MRQKMFNLRSIILALALLGSAGLCSAQDIFFRKKAYASNLEVQTAVATSDQLSQLIEDDSPTLDWFHQKPQSELKGSDVYVFVRVWNTGDQAAWGTLAISVNNRRPFDVDIPIIGRSGKRSWRYYIINNSGMYQGDEKPKVTTKWKKLYAK
jgi:hypothetical protein